jgi:hypothetical protein
MEVSGKLHITTALLPEKEPPSSHWTHTHTHTHRTGSKEKQSVTSSEKPTELCEL